MVSPAVKAILSRSLHIGYDSVMGRALEFDYEKALDEATKLFWKHGYSGTSLRALLRAMGIGEGSFYNTLKSKKCLYLECLKHYNQTVGTAKATTLLTAPTASLGVRAFFRSLFDTLDDPRAPRVCMLAASVTCDVLAEPDLRAYVLEQVAMMIGGLAARLAIAKQAGELPTNFDPAIVARIIITYTQGLYQTTLIAYDRAQLERQVDVFLSGMGL